MIIGGLYSFNGGQGYVHTHFPYLLDEVRTVIAAVDAGIHKTKRSEEKTSAGKMFFSPSSLNRAYRAEFERFAWQSKRQNCVYPTDLYTSDYHPKAVPNARRSVSPYREMDFVKDRLGIEVQFGKYAFMVYNVCAKMTIFRNLGHIDAGIEIVPLRQFAMEMSTGVSYFEQFAWDLSQRGVSNIDVPVLIIGVDAKPEDRVDVGEQDLSAAEPEQQEQDLLDQSIQD